MPATVRRRPLTPQAPPHRVSPRWLAGARRYARRYLARHFHAVRLVRAGAPPDVPDHGPLIVVQNHPSWWDPILGLILSERLPGRTPYAPSEAAALARYPLLGRLGLFGIGPGPGGTRAFLRVGAGVLADPGGALWVTAQGRFADPRERPCALQAGVGHLAARTPGVCVVPLAVEYPFWGERTPEALALFGEPIRLDDGSAAEWTGRIALGLEAAQDALARAATVREPAAFEVLVAGRAGVGGIYDLWRRARAALGGRDFRTEHDEAHSAWR